MVTARNAVRESGVRYKCHQPELTLLYQIIETYYPEFFTYMKSQGKTLPTHIKKEFDAYLKCGRLEHGFIRVRCEECHHERLVAFSCKKRGLLRASCPAPFGPAFGSSNRSRRFSLPQLWCQAHGRKCCFAG